MRRPFTAEQAARSGLSAAALKWRVRQSQHERVERGVYLEGADPPTELEQSLALLIVVDGVGSGTLAAVLLGLDSVRLSPPFVTVPSVNRSTRNGLQRRDLNPDSVTKVMGYRCTDWLQTTLDLAAVLDDIA